MSATDDIDLTNLNWVAGAPVPLPANFTMSPPEQKSPTIRNRGTPNSPFRGCASATSSPATHSRPVEIVVTSPWRKDSNQVSQITVPTTPICDSIRENESECQKPNCSYTCLIGMALRASSGTDGCLPVNEVYRYIEKEFPYFKTAPDGWKNSVRHNLSLNSAFRKVTRNDGWQGKKGFFWEIAPEKKHVVNSEVDTFLKSTGRELQPHSTLLASPIQPTVRRDKLSLPRQSTPRKASTPKATPKKQKVKPLPDAAQYSPQVQSQIAASEISINPKLSPTEQEFDMNNTPSEYIGIEAPSTDLNESARELFGLDTTPVPSKHQSQELYSGSSSSDGPLYPWYTPITPYYGALYGYPVPIAGSSPSPLVGVAPPSPFIPQYLPPQYLHYMPNDMTGVIYGAPPIGNQMVLGMGYSAPKFVDEQIIEHEEEVMDSSNDERYSNSAENVIRGRYRQKKTPSTPTSHYACRNGHAAKRLRLNDCQDSNTVPPAQLAATEGQEVSVDNIFEELLRQRGNTSENNKYYETHDESNVTIHGLSDDERDHLGQIAGVFTLEHLLKNGINSLSTFSGRPTEIPTTDAQTFNNDSLSSTKDTAPHIHSHLQVGDHSVCNEIVLDIQGEETLDISICPPSPVGAEEIVVETYQG